MISLLLMGRPAFRGPVPCAITQVNDCSNAPLALTRERFARKALFAKGFAMDKLIIRGGNRLSGTIPISGAKNAALTPDCNPAYSIRLSRPR